MSRRAAKAMLRKVAENRVPVFNDLPSPLRRATLLYWGSMAAARDALALPRLDAPRQAWSLKRIIGEVRALHRAGIHMSANAVIKAGRTDLVLAAGRYAGGWVRARQLAGVRFARRPSPTANAWDAASVLAEIVDRRRRNLPIAVSKSPKALVNAANRIFGSWRDAIEAAGIDYATVALSRTYADEELLAWLRRLASSRPRMTLWDLDQHGEHAVVCRRRWGSYERAAAAAGIAGWPIRERAPALSRAKVIRALRSRHAAKLPLNIRGVRKSRGGHSLVNSALHRFATWDDALAAAGLRARASVGERRRQN